MNYLVQNVTPPLTQGKVETSLQMLHAYPPWTFQGHFNFEVTLRSKLQTYWPRAGLKFLKV